jgi:ribosomal protein S18 acetylase RimI-like enzyme
MKSRILQALKTYRFTLPWMLLKKGLAPFVRIETLSIYRLPLSAVATEAKVPNSPLAVVRIADTGSELLRKLCAKYTPNNFASRINQERCCYVALRGDVIAGYAWVATGALYIDEIARACRIPAGEIFIYDAFVDAEQRGRGIYPAMLAAVLADYRREGNTQAALIAAASVNQASIRGIRKAGFEEWKKVGYLEWRKKQRWWGLDDNVYTPAKP